MLVVKGCFDGTYIKLLEDAHARENQKVIVTILDEYVDKKSFTPKKSVFGMLAEYAQPLLIDQEKNAWKKINNRKTCK